MATRRRLSGSRGTFDSLRKDLKRGVDDLELLEVTKTGKILGHGAYGSVFEVTVFGTRFAAKEIHATISSTKNIDYFLDECVYNSRLRHPNIVQLVGVYYPSLNDDLPWLVMELMNCSLRRLIEDYEVEGKDIPFHYKRSVLIDIGQGLQFLHSRHIIHRDLSANNVLLTKGYVAKIADLGVAKAFDPKITQQEQLTQAPGTAAFMPPEALQNNPQYGRPLDVFSLGCVCIHLVSMKWPTPAASKQMDGTTGRVKCLQMTEFQRREEFLAKFDELPPELKNLVEQCLKDSPADRPPIEDVVESLRSIECDPLPHDDDDILRLHTSLIDCEEALVEKEKELDQCIKEKCKKIAEKSRQLENKDLQLAEMTRQLQNKESLLKQCNIKKDHLLAVKDQQLAEKDRQLAEKNQQFEAEMSEKQKYKVYVYIVSQCIDETKCCIAVYSVCSDIN